MREQRTIDCRALHLRVWQWLVAVFIGGVISLMASGGLSLAFADSPAVTDFGQDSAATAMTERGTHSQALFLTLYPDGREQIEIRTVHGDAVTGFAGEHPGWKLDSGLMWFVQMPVYIRDLSNRDENSSADSV